MTTSTRTHGRVAGAVHREDAPSRAFLKGVRAARLPDGPPQEAAVTEADLAPLPPAVRRYLRHMGAVGRPPDWSFRAHLTGRFRRRPGDPWMACDAWQYNTRLDVARLFRMRLRVGPVPMTGWDTYLHGHGRMRGRLAGVIPVVDGNGGPFDVGELVTYLNDAVLLAPSMLLGPHTTWASVDDDAGAFDVTLSDAGNQVTARVFLDGDGAPCHFATTDRFADLPGGLIRARWSTPVAGWRVVDGRRLPTAAAAVWQLPNGPFSYAEFEVPAGAVVFNVPPGRAAK